MIRLMDLILENGEAATQAHSMGLEYMGWGTWGKNGIVTHETQNDKLIAKTANQKPSPTKPAGNKSSSGVNLRTPVDAKTDKPDGTGPTAPPVVTASKIKPSVETAPQKYSAIIKGEIDVGTVSAEAFKSQSMPTFDEETEATADADETRSRDSILSVDNAMEVFDALEVWKWGGDEGQGVWSFEPTAREKLFETVTQHIRNSNSTVQAARLHRGIALDSAESAQTFLEQFTPGQSIELPPSGWTPRAETAMRYGPDNTPENQLSVMMELEAGDTPIRGMSAAHTERNMGMDIQHEVITPGNMQYNVREVKRYTVTENGKSQTIYKIILRQSEYITENAASKRKKYSILAYMGGSMATAQNIRKHARKK